MPRFGPALSESRPNGPGDVRFQTVELRNPSHQSARTKPLEVGGKALPGRRSLRTSAQNTPPRKSRAHSLGGIGISGSISPDNGRIVPQNVKFGGKYPQPPGFSRSRTLPCSASFAPGSSLGLFLELSSLRSFAGIPAEPPHMRTQLNGHVIEKIKC